MRTIGLYVALFAILGFMCIGFVTFIKNKYVEDQKIEKEISLNNNCVTQGLNYDEKLFVCEKEIMFNVSSSNQQHKVSRENILSIKIKPYTYVSSNLIGTENNIKSNAIYILDKNDTPLLKLTRIDNEIILNNIKDNFKKYNYNFTIEQ